MEREGRGCNGGSPGKKFVAEPGGFTISPGVPKFEPKGMWPGKTAEGSR